MKQKPDARTVLRDALRKSLIEIRDGVNRVESHGICINLIIKMNETQICQSTTKTTQFTQNAITKFYGRYASYPIEGSPYQYNCNPLKWDVNTDYGAERLSLLDFMIEEVENYGKLP